MQAVRNSRNVSQSYGPIWSRLHSTATSVRPGVRIIEVSPRDGLQNEKGVIDTETKASLILKLSQHGFRDIEAGSFVSPKVKQMADTSNVLQHAATREASQNANFSVLVPNLRGFENLQKCTAGMNSNVVGEVSIFAAATEAFSNANLNASVSVALDRLGEVAEQAKRAGYRIRGYVSCIVGCPFEGRVDPIAVRHISEVLGQMGCYEISLCDTIGVGTPNGMEEVLNTVVSTTPMEKIAIHCHDTFGTAVANVLHMADLGVRNFDSSIAGLGGCPFAPGASGNVATEDVVYALETQGYDTGLGIESSPSNHSSIVSKVAELAKTGLWISEKLGRNYSVNAGRAALASQASRF